MAIPLEQELMQKIGLGCHYNYYNGSGSCRYIRTKAAERLKGIIQQQRAKELGSIAGPDERLIRLLARVAKVGDASDYVLTKTWQAASYIIAAHIHGAYQTHKERSEYYVNTYDYIVSNYIPVSKVADWLLGNAMIRYIGDGD